MTHRFAKQALATLGMALGMPLFCPQARAQPGREPGTDVSNVPQLLGQINVINGRSIASERTRVDCPRGSEGDYGPGTAFVFSVGFPAIEAIGRRGTAQGSYNIRNIVNTKPPTVAAYLFDGKFNDHGQALAGGEFTLLGTMNWQGACRLGTPPPPRTVITTIVNVTLRGTCGTNKDLAFEARDASGVFATGSFKANVTCASGRSFAGVDNTLDRH